MYKINQIIKVYVYEAGVKYLTKGVNCMESQEYAFDFGLRLTQLRKSKKLSQAEVARRIGVSKNTIYRYEHNLQEPTRENLAKLATAYNTTVDYLIGLNGSSPFVLYGLTENQQQVMRDLVKYFIGDN